MDRPIGTNEALILTVLHPLTALSVADVAFRIESENVGRTVDDGSIYLALHRMSQRGLVSVAKRSVISADGRPRDVGYYMITDAGENAVSRYVAESRAVIRLRDFKGVANA